MGMVASGRVGVACDDVARRTKHIDRRHDNQGNDSSDDDPGEAFVDHLSRYEGHAFEGSARRRPSASVAGAGSTPSMTRG